MPKGKYIISDLCYCIDDEWDQVCQLLFSKSKGNSRLGGEFVLDNGVKFALYSTAWGDGCYKGSDGFNYGVDAGVIGCIKVDDLYKMGESPSSLGNIHEFPEDFETGYEDGVIKFGHITIDTDPGMEDEDEDETCSTCGHSTYSVACYCDEEE